jgi:hypothetical protein
MMKRECTTAFGDIDRSGDRSVALPRVTMTGDDCPYRTGPIANHASRCAG